MASLQTILVRGATGCVRRNVRSASIALVLVAAAVALGACSAGTPASQEPALAQSGSGTVHATPSPERVFAGHVTLPDGRDLQADCWGSGSPTILLEAGGTRSNMNAWDYGFLMQLAEQNTVCRYSRAGGEGSTAPDGLLTYDIAIGDAFDLLGWLRDERDIGPPYVFVGWSFGGFMALAEALERPDDTAGVVILDTDPPGNHGDFMTVCTGSGRTTEDCQAEIDADREAIELGAEIEARVRPLPDLPAAVVSALFFPDCRLEPGESTVAYNMNGADVTAPDCEQLAQRVADIHLEGWTKVFPEITQTRVMAEHDRLTAQAGDAIVEVIQEVVARAAP